MLFELLQGHFHGPAGLVGGDHLPGRQAEVIGSQHQKAAIREPPAEDDLHPADVAPRAGAFGHPEALESALGIGQADLLAFRAQDPGAIRAPLALPLRGIRPEGPMGFGDRPGREAQGLAGLDNRWMEDAGIEQDPNPKEGSQSLRQRLEHVCRQLAQGFELQPQGPPLRGAAKGLGEGAADGPREDDPPEPEHQPDEPMAPDLLLELGIPGIVGRCPRLAPLPGPGGIEDGLQPLPGWGVQ